MKKLLKHQLKKTKQKNNINVARRYKNWVYIHIPVQLPLPQDYMHGAESV